MKATLEEVVNGTAEFLHRAIDGETVVVYRGDRADLGDWSVSPGGRGADT